MGAALTTPGRASTARWCGSGKRDGEEYARNQRDYVPRKVNRLKSGGYGPGAVRTCRLWLGRELSGWLVGVGSGGHGDVLRGSRGDAAGTESGSSFVERITVNMGTVSVLARLHAPSVAAGLGPSSTDRVGTGRSRRSSPRPGEPVTWGRAAAVSRREEAAMAKDAPLNGGAPTDGPVGPCRRVSEMQTKLHRWAAADPGRRFDDLFNLVHDPATLIVAFDRVAGNTGARSPGVDGLTVADVEDRSVSPGSWTTCAPS